MHAHRKTLHFFRILSDLIVLSASFWIALTVIGRWQQRSPAVVDFFIFLCLLIVWFFSSRITHLYDEFRARDYSFELIAVLKNVLIQVIGCIFILFVIKEGSLSRSFVLIYAGALTFFLPMEGYALRKILYYLRKGGRNLRHILLVGAGEVGMSFYQTIVNNPHFGYRLVGFLDDRQKSFLNGQYLGSIDDLERVLDRNEVDDVIVALPAYATERIDDVIKTCSNHTTRVRIIPDYFRFVSDKFEISMFDRFPIISVRNIKLDELHWYIVKRLFDGIFALVICVAVLSWLVPIIALCIKLTSRGPVFFKQERWGRNNRKIVCFKFRSMIVTSKDVDDCGKYQQATKDDPRITPIGKFLRKTNLDEIPQFLNVLTGEMSIVGPRPHPTPLNLESKDVIQNYMLRHLVKPGITGWAQVNGFRGETRDPSLMQKRIDHDLWYIENWSFWLDIQIILLTAWQMLRFRTNAY